MEALRAYIAEVDTNLVDWASGGLLTDPKKRLTSDWPLSTLESALFVTCAYLLFIAGFAWVTRSRYGTKEPPSQLGKSVIGKVRDEPIVLFQMVYNLIQVAFCAYMVFEAARQFVLRGFSAPFCNAFEPLDAKKSLGMARVLHIFYLTKVLDFFDTVFMVARRKWRQLSFLHLYHHTTIFLVYWLISQSGYDGDIYFTIVANGFIHFIMYSYYFARSINVKVPTMIKMTVTNAQLIQFVCMNAQAIYLLLNPQCGYPRNLTWIYLFYIFTMIALFANFKAKTYKANGDGKNPRKKANTMQTEKETHTTKRHDPINEVLVDGILYDVGAFNHPGGSIIRFLQGHGDATEAWHEFHARSKKAKLMLKSLPSRKAPKAVLDARQGNGRPELARDFAALREELRVEGFFDASPTEIIYRISELILMHCVGAFSVLAAIGFFHDLPLAVSEAAVMAGIGKNMARAALFAFGIVTLGIASGRCGWLMHEGGHHSMTGHIFTDKVMQAVIYGFGCGMSGSWWTSQHNKHHCAPQKLEHDVDLDTMPLVAFNAAVFEEKGVRSPILRAWLRLQHILFIPVSCALVAAGWQFYLHPRMIWRNLTSSRARKGASTFAVIELLSLVLRYCVFFGILCRGLTPMQAIATYFAYNGVAASYIFTNFALSHTHLPVTDKETDLHWAEYASDHTTNIAPNVLCNWWMAYLNFQIEHHLFPSMPQFNHPQIAPRVRALFKKHGLRYDVRPYFSCLWETLGNLQEVGAKAAGASGKNKVM